MRVTILLINDKRKIKQEDIGNMEPRLGKLSHAFWAGVLWAVWAIIANFSDSEPEQLFLTASLQFALSMTTTATLLLILNAWFRFFNQKILKIILPPLLTSSLTNGVIAVLHSIGNTENVIITVAPTFFVSLIYGLILTTRAINPRLAQA